MLTELRVRQFALMDEVELEFTSGMTVFTGETGAGKSILVDALGAVFGVRANSDWVRHGADKAEVTATLEIDDPRLSALLKDQDMEDDEQLFLRRVINADGRSKAYINGVPSPMKLLQQIGNVCLDLHGQHEHQALLSPEFQREIIDSRVQQNTLEDCALAFSELQQIQRQLDALHGERSDSLQQESWMREELARLLDLEVSEGLQEMLLSDVEVGRNVSQIQQAAAHALQCIDEGDINARALMADATHAVDGASDYHQGLKEAAEIMAQIDALMGELEPSLRDAMDVALDAESLEAAENRLAGLRDAKRRHQTDEIGLMALIAEWEIKVSRLETVEWDESKLKDKHEQATQTYQQAAQVLSNTRSNTAKDLSAALRPFLDRLGLEGMQVDVVITAHETETPEWKSSGWDQVQFMASSNPGEPMRELAAIASGGEISRFVLALKGCGALANAPDVAVFDEVDVGIGGETAWCVGELLAAMGKERQVFVVSHLPQVAACADHQICIRKMQQDGRTLTRLQAADDRGRQEEIARMLGGANQESMGHAQQMLERGRKVAA
ncbi:MAG: DNA repair protein RecN [Mariprofundaceae bacterium]